MPEVTISSPAPQERSLDRQLLLSLMLPPLAAAISTIVGYTVAHWITITASKRTGYIVSFGCLALCAIAAILARTAQRRLGLPDETQPQQGRRLFMAKLGLLLSALSAILVVAGTLVLLTVGPSD